MTVRVKICGINDPGALRAAAESGADWIGFVFFPPSPRFVTPAEAGALSGSWQGGPRRVGLFVDPSDEAIASTLAHVSLDVLQLYAAPARAAAARARFGLPVWRAVGVAGPDDLPPDMAGADALVVEARPPAGATRPGGNAVSLDWSMLAGWIPPGPWLLAGGLTPENVAAAVRSSGAAAVDVSSGVETVPGRKSAERIARFVAAVHLVSGASSYEAAPLVPST